jgi:glycosyltransferase involved in cell wall biosynthesis
MKKSGVSKRVSVVSFHSPPGTGSAHTFVENLLVTLADAGCDLTVIGADPSVDKRVQVGGSGGSGGSGGHTIQYVHIPFVELPQKFRRFRNLPGSSVPALSVPAAPVPVPMPVDRDSGRSWKGRLKDALWMSIIPDRQVTWTPRAALALIRQRKDRPEHIIGVFRPSSSLLAAMVGAKFLRVPWTAILMDPWSEMESSFTDRPKFLRALDAKIDQRVLKSAANVVAVTQEYQTRLHTRGLPNVFWCPTIPELGGLHAVTPRNPDDPNVVNLLYCGTLYGELRDYRTLVDGLKLAVDSGVQVHLTVAGGNTKPVHTYAEQIGVAHAVTWLGKVSWEEATGRMKGPVINVILLWNGPERYMIASKLFECLVAGRPILAIGPHDDPAARHLTSDSVCAQTATQVCVAIRTLAPALKDPPNPQMDFINECHREVGLLPQRLGLTS